MIKRMMTTGLMVLTMSLFFSAYGQSSEKISSMDFVQILGNNRAETIYYYENNWKVLREQALEKGYIHSYQLLEVPKGEDLAFELILITTYRDQAQYDMREDNFGVLIDAMEGRKLLNDKQPAEFRNIVFFREDIRYLFEAE